MYCVHEQHPSQSHPLALRRVGLCEDVDHFCQSWLSGGIVKETSIPPEFFRESRLTVHKRFRYSDLRGTWHYVLSKIKNVQKFKSFKTWSLKRLPEQQGWVPVCCAKDGCFFSVDEALLHYSRCQGHHVFSDDAKPPEHCHDIRSDIKLPPPEVTLVKLSESGPEYYGVYAYVEVSYEDVGRTVDDCRAFLKKEFGKNLLRQRRRITK